MKATYLSCAWLLLPACVVQPRAAPEEGIACEDVEAALLARVRGIAARELTDIPVEQLRLSVQDDADARYVLVDVRAPSGQHLFQYRVERANGSITRRP